MTISTEGVTTQTLSLPEELILMLLNEESGYFHQVPGWDLNCTVAGAVLAELSLLGRIDTDADAVCTGGCVVNSYRPPDPHGVPHRNAAGTYARWRGTH